MDTYSSKEDLLVKTRKPYTITKQRERWTEEEHNRFLEALKLYGRAWQRIEEHIGTKTAVQIRSHAQKFFSKLEREALVKGVPIEQAIDIEIPPPRPKRKPSTPYPRKNGAISSPNIQVGLKDGKQISQDSSDTAKQVLDLEKELVLEKCDDGNQNIKPTSGKDKFPVAFTLFQEAPSNLAASSNENSSTVTEAARNSCNFKEFAPLKAQLVSNDRSDYHAADGHNKIHNLNKPANVEIVQNETENETHAAKNFPRHAPVQILDGSLGACSQALSSDVSYQESAFHRMRIPNHPALFSNHAVSMAVESQSSTSRSTNAPIFPSSQPPFTPLPSIQEDYSSLLQMSSTFSCLIVSALLQNPALHAAASYVASFWPSTNMESSANSLTRTNGGFPPRPINPAPSMAAMAAATVAAATAWWEAHGLLPFWAPVPGGFSCPASAAAPSTNSAQNPAVNGEREDNNFPNPGSHGEQLDQEFTEALQPQLAASKSSATSSSDTGHGSGAKMNGRVETSNIERKAPATTERKDPSKGKNKKQVDRSSCGSNTPSGSDIETAALEKNDKGKEEPREADISNPASEPSSRRNRMICHTSETWKEVSEEGRLAFQALFSREVLPQSFSPPPDVTNKEPQMNDGLEINRQNAEKNNEEESQLDLNSNAWESCSVNQGSVRDGSRDHDDRKELTLAIDLAQGKLKARNTGFKPYKRCSVEARESRMVKVQLPRPRKMFQEITPPRGSFNLMLQVLSPLKECEYFLVLSVLFYFA